MTDLVRRAIGPGGKLRGHMIWCPGCRQAHMFTTEPWERDGKPGPTWTFNGDLENPTFSPSMLVNADYPESRCHSFVKNGDIQFLGDCFHELAGKTLPLEPAEDW